ncbi:unnamed protein product, partial [Iphiclides podalirius]
MSALATETTGEVVSHCAVVATASAGRWRGPRSGGGRLGRGALTHCPSPQVITPPTEKSTGSKLARVNGESVYSFVWVPAVLSPCLYY